jgi:hypothetical protein
MSVSLSLEKMSTEEKLQMMELLWEDLSHSPNKMLSPSWHGDILRAREANLEQFEDWEDAKQKIEEEIRCGFKND